MCGVLLGGVVVSLVWFGGFGVLGMESGKKRGKIFDMGGESGLFGVFNEVGLGFVLWIVRLVLMGRLFIR